MQQKKKPRKKAIHGQQHVSNISMIRSLIYLVIIIIGLGLAQYQFFSHAKFSDTFSNDPTYQRINGELKQFNQWLAVLSEKLIALGSKSQDKETPDPTVAEKPVSDRSIVNSENVLYYTNLERTSRGLKPLRFSSKLTRSTNAKARDMFTFQYFAHTSPHDSKKGFAYFIDNENYNFARVSENLAMGEFMTAKEVVDAWMNSPDHRANILFPDYRDIGGAVQTGIMNGNQVFIIVEHFGIPKNACPIVSQASLDDLRSLEQEALAARKVATDLEYKINQDSSLSNSDLDALIEEYNTAIRKYNSLATQFGEVTSQYNAQVKSYDDCINKLN